MRRATLADLPLVASLFDAYREFYGELADAARARGFLAERMRREESVIYLAVDAEAARGPALGFAQLYPSFSSVSTARLWILNDLFVAPAARRRGVASALMDAARAHAVGTGAARIELTTRHDNSAARRLYEALGFEKDQEFVAYRISL